MQASLTRLAIPLLAAAIVWVAPATAEDMSSGKEPAGTAGPLDGALTFKRQKATPLPGIAVDRSASRALALDPAATEKAFTLVSRSRDGKTTSTAPGENVLKAIRGEAPAKPEKQGKLEGDATTDPQFAEEEEARSIDGADTRLAIKDSTIYPYSAVGYLETTNAKGEVFSCSAALVGRSTVITAAHCLFDYTQKDGWYEKYTYWPAINGADKVPFGGYDYETAYVFEGFITGSDGTYDSVWPYDIGLVTFSQQIGDATGWLGYRNFADAGDFQANMVGYHNDKPAFTAWRSTCDVLTEGINETDFNHDCDAGDGSSGAPLFVYDPQTKSRLVVGVNMGGAGSVNWALRLYQPVYEWMQTIIK